MLQAAKTCMVHTYIYWVYTACNAVTGVAFVYDQLYIIASYSCDRLRLLGTNQWPSFKHIVSILSISTTLLVQLTRFGNHYIYSMSSLCTCSFSGYCMCG